MNPNEFAAEDENDADYKEWKENLERIEEHVRRVGRRDLGVLARVGRTENLWRVAHTAVFVVWVSSGCLHKIR